MSDLLNVRLIAEPPAAGKAVDRTVLSDGTADRQHALEQAERSLAGLIARWRASTSPAAGEAAR